MGRPKKKSRAKVKMPALKSRLKRPRTKPRPEPQSPSSSPNPEGAEGSSGGRVKAPYYAYNHDELTAAYNAVKEEGYSVSNAAKVFGIPRSTLYDKIHGRTSIDVQRKGPAPLISTEDEKKLADYLLQMSSLGYSFSLTELIDLASELAHRKGKLDEDCKLSRRWHKSFRQRWPVLDKVFGPIRTIDTQKSRQKKKEKEESSRRSRKRNERDVYVKPLNDNTYITVENYFTELRILMHRYGVVDKPGRIYCVDEVAIQYESGFPKAKPIKSLHNVIMSRSEYTVISVMGCGNAMGSSIPPYLVYPGSKLSDELFKGKYPGVQATLTNNGKTDYNTFRTFLENHFIEHALLGMSKTPPVLVLYDGNKSKVGPDTIEWAKSRNIILFVLPPGTTSLTQPLEKGCFTHFKELFTHEVRLFRELTGADTIKKGDICRLVSQVYPQAFSVKHLVDSFEESGIFPLNPSVVLESDVRQRLLTEKKREKALLGRKAGMVNKGVQVTMDVEVKRGVKRKAPYPTTTQTVVGQASQAEADYITSFFRDKKLQKMLGENETTEDDDDDDDEDDDDDDDDEDESEEVVEEIPQQTYYIVQQPTHSAGDHAYNEAYTEDVGEVAQVENQPEYKTEYKIVTEDEQGNQRTLTQESLMMNDPEQVKVAVQALQSIAHEIQIIQGEPATVSTTETGTKQEPLIPTNSKSAFTNLQNEQLQIITGRVDVTKNPLNPQLHIITDTGDVQEQIEIESSVSSIMNE